MTELNHIISFLFSYFSYPAWLCWCIILSLARVPNFIAQNSLYLSSIAGCYFDIGMFHDLLVAIFRGGLFANIPFCRKQFANLLQGCIFVGNGQFGHESSHLCVEKSYVSKSIHTLVALSNARFARSNWRWECTTEYEAQKLIISPVVVGTATHSKQCDFGNATTDKRPWFAPSPSFVVASIPSWFHHRIPAATAATVSTVTSPGANGNHCHCSKCEMCFW